MVLAIRDVIIIMETNNNKNGLFIIGMLSLVICLCFATFSFYMLPHLMFGWRYDIPGFILILREWLQSHYGYTASVASRFILAGSTILAGLFGFIAHLTSNSIDSEILNEDIVEVEKPAEMKESTREGLGIGLKIIFIIIGVFCAGALFEWLIYTPPPEIR